MLLVLFGGVDYSGLCSNEVRLFDPIHSRWCEPEEVGVTLQGEPPIARAGHSAGAIGRHLLIFFGGRTEGGVSDELHALVQHRPEMNVSIRSSALTWSQPALEG